MRRIHWSARHEAELVAREYTPVAVEEPADWLVQPYSGVYLVVHGTADQVIREVRDAFDIIAVWEIQPIDNDEWREHLEATAVRLSIDEALRLRAGISGGEKACQQH